MNNLENISTKLDVLIRLTAAGITNSRPLKEQVRVLSAVGMRPKDIAEILDKKPNHIAVIVHELKKSNYSRGNGTK